MKNLNRWPTDRYLNIWVVKTIDGGGFLGFAYLPPAPISVDGIVIIHTAFGDIGTAAAPYNLGRTLTHEAGHYLNLLHTFQNGCAGTSAATCATAGDLVCDTPPTKFANYGCPGPQNSCTESPTDSPDQTRNYMDYGDDACIDMFTAGQTVRQQAVMTGVRANLTSQTNLISTGCAVVGCSVALTSKTNVLCPCEATGAINITASSSDTPINYSWSNGASTEDLTSISAATYTVTITDSKSCTATLSTVITEPAPIVITLVSQTNIACFGKSTGQIVVQSSGGVGPYDFSIDGGIVYTYNNIASATSVTFSILPAGIYTIKVRDGNSCITQP